MPMEPIRIGVVGSGRFGSLHAQTLLSLAESELVALVDSSEKALAQLPEALSAIPKYLDLEQALKESRAEAWVVATSTLEHVPGCSTPTGGGFTMLGKVDAGPYPTFQQRVPGASDGV